VDPGAEAAALASLEIIKPDTFVNLGDCGEFNSLSSFKGVKSTLPDMLDHLHEDVLAANEGLDKWDSVLDKIGCKERHFIQGNHEERLDRLTDEIPHLVKAGYTTKGLLRLGERGYKYHPYGTYVKFGRLNIVHGGHFATKNHAAQTLVNCGKSVLYGHFHSMAVARMSSLDGDIGAWCVGCVAKLSARFNKGRPVGWAHGFATVHVRANGDFQVTVHDIIKGRVNVWGREVVAWPGKT
jgi:hypothetical protein